MNAMHAAWMTTFGALVLWFVILYKVKGSPDLLLRWRRGDRIRFRLRRPVVALPAVATIVWIGPTIGKGVWPVSPPPTWISALEEEAGDDAGLQQKLETRITYQIATALSEGIGAEHFRIIVQAETNERGEPRSLFLDLAVDESRVDYDAESDTYSVNPRSPQEIDAAVETAKSVAGFDEARGDRISLRTPQLDHAEVINRQIAHRREAKREVWTYRAIQAAKVMGVLGQVLIFRFVVLSMEQSMISREEEAGPTDSASEGVAS